MNIDHLPIKQLAQDQYRNTEPWEGKNDKEALSWKFWVEMFNPSFDIHPFAPIMTKLEGLVLFFNQQLVFKDKKISCSHIFNNKKKGKEIKHFIQIK